MASLFATAAQWVLAIIENVSCYVEAVRDVTSASLAWLLPEPAHERVVVSGRFFELLRLLGEGGYAYVYLAREAGNPLAEYAIKRVCVIAMQACSMCAHPPCKPLPCWTHDSHTTKTFPIPFVLYKGSAAFAVYMTGRLSATFGFDGPVDFGAQAEPSL